MEKGGENLSLGQTSSAVRRRRRRTVLGGSGGASPPAIDPRGFFSLPSSPQVGRRRKENFLLRPKSGLRRGAEEKKKRKGERERTFLSGGEGNWRLG